MGLYKHLHEIMKEEEEPIKDTDELPDFHTLWQEKRLPQELDANLSRLNNTVRELNLSLCRLKNLVDNLPLEKLRPAIYDTRDSIYHHPDCFDSYDDDYIDRDTYECDPSINRPFGRHTSHYRPDNRYKK